ncbi:unnamed protein product, partial [Laminaria digitata]
GGGSGGGGGGSSAKGSAGGSGSQEPASDAVGGGGGGAGGGGGGVSIEGGSGGDVALTTGKKETGVMDMHTEMDMEDKEKGKGTGRGVPAGLLKKTSSVMELIREREAAAKAARLPPERKESAAVLSPSFAAVRKRGKGNSRPWGSGPMGAGTEDSDGEHEEGG